MSQTTAALMVREVRLTRLLERIASRCGYDCLVQTPRLGSEAVTSEATTPGLVVVALEGDEALMLSLLENVYQAWGDRRLVLLGISGPQAETMHRHARSMGFSDVHPLILPSGLKQLRTLFATGSRPAAGMPHRTVPLQQHTEE